MARFSSVLPRPRAAVGLQAPWPHPRPQGHEVPAALDTSTNPPRLVLPIGCKTRLRIADAGHDAYIGTYGTSTRGAPSLLCRQIHASGADRWIEVECFRSGSPGKHQINYLPIPLEIWVVPRTEIVAQFTYVNHGRANGTMRRFEDQGAIVNGINRVLFYQTGFHISARGASAHVVEGFDGELNFDARPRRVQRRDPRPDEWHMVTGTRTQIRINGQLRTIDWEVFFVRSYGLPLMTEAQRRNASRNPNYTQACVEYMTAQRQRAYHDRGGYAGTPLGDHVTVCGARGEREPWYDSLALAHEFLHARGVHHDCTHSTNLIHIMASVHLGTHVPTAHLETMLAHEGLSLGAVRGRRASTGQP